MVPAEPHLTVTEQESPPAALCIAVRRIFSSHTLSQETSCHAVCLQGAKGDVATAASHRYRLLSWAVSRYHPFKQQLGGIRNILPRSVLPLPLRERFVEVKAGTCFFQTCLPPLFILCYRITASFSILVSSKLGGNSRNSASGSCFYISLLMTRLSLVLQQLI